MVEVRELTKFYKYKNDKCDEHYHVKCKECGKLIHFECDDFKKVCEHILQEHKFYVDTKSIIYGICEDCKKKTDNN